MTTQSESKVFCVGWHKTGTTSMGAALLNLGYKVVGARLDTVEDLQAGNIENVLGLASGFDAFQDVPWAALYKELDLSFPGSKFILVERDEDKWLQSAVRHFDDKFYAMHEWLYGEGVLVGNEDLYLARYRRHNAEVKNYFSNRDNFLEFDLAGGDGWQKLCDFLGKPAPATPFPHENKRLHPLSAAERVVNLIRGIAPVRLRRWVFRMRLRIRKLRGLSDPRDRFHNYEANRQNRGTPRR